MHARSKTLTELARAVQAAPSADNTQPWQLSVDDRELRIQYAPRAAGKTFSAEHHATKLAFAGAIENIFQAGEILGIHLDRVSNENPGLTRFWIADEPVLPRSLADTDPLMQRHTNRFAFKRERVADPIIEQIARLQEGAAYTLIIAGRDQIAVFADAVNKASAVRFQSQEVHEILGRSLRFNPREVAHGDGLDLATMDLPPGGRFLLKWTRAWGTMQRLNRFGLYRVFAQAEAKPVRRATLLVGIAGGNAEEAGRLMQRTWIRLNAQGIAVQPYYVISDQLNQLALGKLPPAHAAQMRGVASELQSFTRNQQLHMLLRCGYATRVPPRARRLPLDALFAD